MTSGPPTTPRYGQSSSKQGSVGFQELVILVDGSIGWLDGELGELAVCVAHRCRGQIGGGSGDWIKNLGAAASHMSWAKDRYQVG